MAYDEDVYLIYFSDKELEHSSSIAIARCDSRLTFVLEDKSCAQV